MKVIRRESEAAPVVSAPTAEVKTSHVYSLNGDVIDSNQPVASNEPTVRPQSETKVFDDGINMIHRNQAAVVQQPVADVVVEQAPVVTMVAPQAMVAPPVAAVSAKADKPYTPPVVTA